MYTQWKEEHKIGIDHVDQEHKEIFAAYEKLVVAQNEGQGEEHFLELLAFIKDYMETHLKNEEVVQMEMNYPGYEAHKLMHNAFRDEINAYLSSRYKGVIDVELKELDMFFKKFLNHILNEDVKISGYK